MKNARQAFHELGEAMKAKHAADLEAESARRRNGGKADAMREALADAMKGGREGEPTRRDLLAAAFTGPSDAESPDRAMPAEAADPAPAPPADPEPQKPADPAFLPATSAALFEQIGQRLEAVTAPPPVSTAGAIRQALQQISGADLEQLTARIEAEDYGMPGYLGRYDPHYQRALLVAVIERRLADAQRLQPDLTPAALVEAMKAKG